MYRYASFNILYNYHIFNTNHIYARVLINISKYKTIRKSIYIGYISEFEHIEHTVQFSTLEKTTFFFGKIPTEQ